MPAIARIVLCAALAFVPLATIPSPVAAASTSRPLTHQPATQAVKPAVKLPKVDPAGWARLAPVRRGTRGGTPARVSPRVATQQVIVNGNFESGSVSPGWTPSTNGTRNLVSGAGPHGGLYSADLCQNQANCQDVLLQGLTTPARVINATLTFWFSFPTSDSIAPPAACSDYVGVGLGDSSGAPTQASAYKFCEDWGNSGYWNQTIDETAFLQAHQGQLVYVEGIGATDASGGSRYFIDDYSMTITYATAPGTPQAVLAEPNNRAATLRWQPPADDGGAPITGYQVTSFKNGVANGNAIYNSTTTTEVFPNLSNGTSYTFQVAAMNAAGTSAPTSNSNAVVPSLAYPIVAVSDRQYRLTSNDGAQWIDMDASYLSATVTPQVDSQALLSANADLWTASSGVNQDIGIYLSGGTGTGSTYPTTAGQPEAWKESGGYAGTFSPNAAAVHAVRLLKAGSTYTVKLQWKTNKNVPGSNIFAGAGPIGPDFSPTRLAIQLVPASPLTVVSSSSGAQFVLSGNNGSSWVDLGPTADPTVTITPPAAGSLVVSGNADLWTSLAGVNQDLGITVSGGTGVGTTYPSVAGQPEAWKESGGYAGTFSPNAAFVQAVLPVAGGTPVSLKLQWKMNKQSAGTIFAGAGPILGQYSPTRISAWFIPSTGTSSVQDAAVTNQLVMGANNGTNWADVDSRLTLSISKTTDCLALVSGNADLWTSSGGYNQDIGIQFGSSNGIVTADRVGWKESGGYAGTFSPNAAFVQTTFPIAANTTYTAKLQWKANKAVAASTIYAGAGPVGAHFSPTRLTAVVYCVAAPVVSSITPTSGYSGTAVTINGLNLTGATVNFGTQAAFVQSSSDTQLVVFPPTQTPGTVVDVTATTGGGTSATSAADRFTYSYSGTVLNDAPNIYYRLGESSGTVAADSSGNARNATYSTTGVTLGVSGALSSDTNTAITLDGNSGNVQEVTAAGAPTGSSARSVEAWFKTAAVGPMPIVAYGSPANAGQAFGVYLNGNNIEVRTGGGTTLTFAGTASLVTGAWHHLVVTYAAGATTIQVFIDGNAFGTQTTTTLGTVLDSSGLLVGEDNGASPTFFNGSLDEVAIYGTALSTTQVTNHYKAGTGT